MRLVITDRPAPQILRVLINRPQKRNAIDFDVREQMTQALLAARADSSVRAVVLGGVEGVFSAGGDLARLSQLEGVQIANSLISLKSLFEGRHYSGIKPGLRCAWAGR